jgi:hypothetical protein
MLDAEQCGQYARKFLMRSRQMIDPETRAAMIEIAVYWTQLAAKAADRPPGVQGRALGSNGSSLVPN